MNRENNLNHIADTAISCALSDDKTGFRLLLADLDGEHLRGLAWKLAHAARDAMLGWAKDSGVSEDQAQEAWRTAIRQREQGDVE